MTNIFKIDGRPTSRRQHNNHAMIQLIIHTHAQTLSVQDNQGHLIKKFSISTAKNGTGQIENTGCTPLGKHIISDKIGDGLPKNAVLVGRQFTGEIYDDTLRIASPDRDWILSRILWLAGTELGVNLGKTADGLICDTHARYIYIHGTPDDEPMGVPMSHGCIRMRNDDVIWLYDVVSVGTDVFII